MIKKFNQLFESESEDFSEFENNLQKQSYTELLRQWRFGINPDQFQGKKGEIFKKIMFDKKDQLSHGDQVQSSKNVGWGQ